MYSLCITLWIWCSVQFSSVLLGNFVFTGESVHSFLSLHVFIWLLYQSNSGLIAWVRNHSVLFYFFEEVESNLLIHLYMFGRLHCWSYLFPDFSLLGNFCLPNQSLHLCICLFWFSVSSWVYFGTFMYF